MVLVGFAAITVDVGAMYNARGDLQRTADSAAMAAAAMLSEFEMGEPQELARTAAVQMTRDNRVMGNEVDLDENSDIIFGRANYNAGNNSFSFTPTNDVPDAVRVRVRLSEDSPNGAFSLFFARALGKSSTRISADAIAMMVPRDIAVVSDLSASHTDDSELQHMGITEVNLQDVWDALDVSRGTSGVGNGVLPPAVGDPNVIPPAPGVGPIGPGGGGTDPGIAPNGAPSGPTWGWMHYWGEELTSGYEPTTDPGLVYLPQSVNWANANLNTWLTNVGYNAAEIAALNSSAFDASVDGSGYRGYTTRTAVALGLARWNSGIAGGLWSAVGGPAGNNNNWVSANELTWLVTYPFPQGNWNDFIYNYIRRNNTEMYGANPDYRYRYGLKTFVNYLLERNPSHAATPDLNSTPTQPMQSVKDAVQVMMDRLYELETDDHVSLEIYGTTGRHEVDLTSDFYAVSNRLNEMQAGHYDSYTNIGGGIQRAIEELTSARARPAAKKVIVLLTDGKSNVDEFGEVSNYNDGAAWAVAQAQEAAALGIRIFAVSVGVDADWALMEDLAEIANGEAFYAGESPEEYSESLKTIFETIGGRRPIALIH